MTSANPRRIFWKQAKPAHAMQIDTHRYKIQSSQSGWLSQTSIWRAISIGKTIGFKLATICQSTGIADKGKKLAKETLNQ
jgi:hypothetical protein